MSFDHLLLLLLTQIEELLIKLQQFGRLRLLVQRLLRRLASLKHWILGLFANALSMGSLLLKRGCFLRGPRYGSFVLLLPRLSALVRFWLRMSPGIMIHFDRVLCNRLVEARNVNLGRRLAFLLTLGCLRELALEKLLHHRGSCDLSGVADLEAVERVHLFHILDRLLAHSHHEVLYCFVVV